MKTFTIGSHESQRWHFSGPICYGICIKDNKIFLAAPGFDPNEYTDSEEYSLIGDMPYQESDYECLKRVFFKKFGVITKDIVPLCNVNFKWRTSIGYPVWSEYHFYIVDIDEPPYSTIWKYYWVDIEKYKGFVFKPYFQKAIDYYINEYEDSNSEDK